MQIDGFYLGIDKKVEGGIGMVLGVEDARCRGMYQGRWEAIFKIHQLKSLNKCTIPGGVERGAFSVISESFQS